MTLELMSQLILQIGLPLTLELIKVWESKPNPTSADFDGLRAMEKQNATDRMKVQLAAAGIPLDSPQAVALLALTV